MDAICMQGVPHGSGRLNGCDACMPHARGGRRDGVAHGGGVTGMGYMVMAVCQSHAAPMAWEDCGRW